MRSAVPALSLADFDELARLAAAHSTLQALTLCVRVLLRDAEGQSNEAIARDRGATRVTVLK